MAAYRDYAEPPGSLSYIDLLVTMLMRHEKNLNRLVERLEKILDVLENVAQVKTAERRKKERSNILYI